MPPRKAPELERAIQDLLRAELDFSRAWGAWEAHGHKLNDPERKRVQEAEKKLERAQALAFHLGSSEQE